MPLWNHADDRRAVRNGRSKAVARTRRRASAPHLEGLESRALLSTVQGPGQGVLPAAAAGAQYVPNEVLVQYKAGAGEVERAKTRGRSDAVLNELIHTNAMRDARRGAMELVTVGPGRSVEATIQALKADPAVEFAEPNWIYTTQGTPATSNDLYYTNGSLWGMYGDDPLIGPNTTTNAFGSQAEEAWAAGDTGSTTVYVGVIDEGIQHDHPDLVGNVRGNPIEVSDGRDNDGNGYVDDLYGWDFAGNNNTVYDGGKRGNLDDHGTHVAGTIGARGGNTSGVVGVNWDVKMISAKFLGSRGGTTANAIKAVDYFTDLKKLGVNIVATNNSWGGGGYSQALHEAIIRGATQGILFVAAAGNDGRNNDGSASYPSSYDTSIGTSAVAGAGYDAVIAVAAIDKSGNLASFSNYGRNQVDLGAPGVGIYSTVAYNSYDSYSGTSMATPHVTGAVALYASKYSTSNAAQRREAILRSAIPTSSLTGITSTGGRLSVHDALNNTLNNSSSAPSNSVSAPYTDTFSTNPLADGSPWSFTTTGDWTYDSAAGTLSQSSPGGNGPVERKALLTGLVEPATAIVALIKPTALSGGESRIGVGLMTDPTTGLGFNLVFRGESTGTTVQFLYDNVAWSRSFQPVEPGVPPAWARWTLEAGASYWFRMEYRDGMLYGKVWDSRAAVEPAGWTITLNAGDKGWYRTNGVAALNGGLGGLVYGSETSVMGTFDNVQVGTATAPITGPVIASASSATGGADATTTQLASSAVTYEAAPGDVESYLEPVEPTSDAWVDAILADLKGRRSRLIRHV